MTADEHGEPSGRDEIPKEALEQDYMYEVLGHSRRRYLCYGLSEKTEWSLTELANKIAAMEHGVPERESFENQRDEVYLSLYHIHVPKLANSGVLTFDRGRETVTTARNADQVLTVLKAVASALDA